LPGNEAPDLDVIGEVYGSVPVIDSSGTVTGAQRVLGVGLRKTWALTVASINVTDVLTLTALVTAILVQARPVLGAAPNYWLNQHLAWQGWGPMANSAGDVIFPYQQTLTFSVTVAATAEAPVAPAITAASGTLSA
jgi:hypothetical protein